MITQFSKQLMISKPATIAFLMMLLLGLTTAGYSAQTPVIPESDHLVADDGDTNDRFGRSTTIDGSLILVGASSDDVSGLKNAGSAYLFRKDANGWIQEFKLIASDLNEFGNFGADLDINNNRLIIGATGANTGVTLGGAVYVYSRISQNNILEETILIASDAELGDALGASVAVDGNHIIAGAPGDKISGESSGSVYIFRDDSPLPWVQEAHIVPDDGRTRQFFGAAVAISGNRIIIGAHEPTSLPLLGPGSAYIYRRDAPGVWIQEAILIPPSGTPGDNFGTAVDIDCNRAVVGADFQTVNSLDEAGAVYIYRRDGQSWTLEASLAAPNPVSPGRFGSAVSLSGIYLAVGSSAAYETTVNGGAVYLFKRNGLNSWNCLTTLIHGNPLPPLGVSIGADIDMTDNLVSVSSPFESTPVAEGAGATLLYDTSAFLCTPDINNDATIDTADLGLLIASFGSSCDCCPEDINGDGTVDTADLGQLIGAFGSVCP